MNDAAWTVWPAPAKLNLFLRVTGRRPDGYHALQTVFQLLKWGDTIRLRVRQDGLVERIGTPSYGVPAEQDITVRAARALQRAAGSPLGVDIAVDKQIPLGGGFGGGSSDAATVLVALNHLWRLSLSVDRLAGIGLELGADVPVFVRGRNAWAEGVGEKLTAVHLPEAWYLLIDSAVHVPTHELFQSPQLTRDQKLVKIESYVSGSLLENAFEPVVRQLQPRIDRVFESMARFGKVALTGTGGGCFMRFDSKEAACEAQVKLPDGYRSWVVESASESPLLQAVTQAQRESIT
ncbi:MAG TPA: 4-(cytidine 5'-diphospho)-2-C-methyl-D-erythritol kinase [Arenimonas sp.]|nr:4-(cytidine 5'-diphospho)-2-C-methyl-D-erythritol kinase [Arenimonas sp.]